jgi:hypothetical protein
MTFGKIMLAVVLALPAFATQAQGAAGARVRIAGVQLGSGVPVAGQAPADSLADHVADGDFHVPGVLPGHPTAASLWPRVVRVACDHRVAQGELRCGGYDVAPLRGEYIYVRPVMLAPTTTTPARPHKKPLG